MRFEIVAKAEVLCCLAPSYADGVLSLPYRFDDCEPLIERIVFPGAPAVLPERAAAFDSAVALLQAIAGVSYYKALLPPRIDIASLSPGRAALLTDVYVQGLGEFAVANGIDLRGYVAFDGSAPCPAAADLGLSRRTLVPIGGGKDSIVTLEALHGRGEPVAASFVGSSDLIAACARQSGAPVLNIGRHIAPGLFELNRRGAYNGHIPVTAINSAILVCAALLYGYDGIAFSNEASASSANLTRDGQPINHQWSKGWDFERAFAHVVRTEIAADLAYYSYLRQLSELAVAQRFASLDRYHAHFSSCNRNFKILGPRPESRWCGECPKCHFVFLALAPFMTKPALLAIFGRNYLDDPALAPAFDALLEWGAHKPFECVGEGRESRAAMAALAERADWREDALIQRYRRDIAPHIGRVDIEPLLRPSGEHGIPARVL